MSLPLERQKDILILLKHIKLKNSVTLSQFHGRIRQRQNSSRRKGENSHLVICEAGARQSECVRIRETEKVT